MSCFTFLYKGVLVFGSGHPTMHGLNIPGEQQQTALPYSGKSCAPSVTHGPAKKALASLKRWQCVKYSLFNFFLDLWSIYAKQFALATMSLGVLEPLKLHHQVEDLGTNSVVSTARQHGYCGVQLRFLMSSSFKRLVCVVRIWSTPMLLGPN